VIVSPARHSAGSGCGPVSGFQVAGEGFDVAAADGEQAHAAGPAPDGELAQVQGVGLAGQAAVAGQVPGEGEPFGAGEDGLDRGERGGWGAVVIGRLPAGLRPWRLGRLRVPAIERNLTVSRLAALRYATNERAPEHSKSL